MPARSLSLTLSLVALTSCFTMAERVSAADAPGEWEKNNNWTVEISNSPMLTSPVFVALRLAGTRWEIVGIYDRPPAIPRSQQLELFVATRDLQRWSNFYTNAVANCDSFEAKEADFHSVCTSALSERQSAGAAALGLFFGGNTVRPVSYNRQRVTAAVQSISVEQALTILTAFERAGK